MIRYTFKEDEPIRIKGAGKANAQVIGEALHALSNKAGGNLKPEAVVEAAQDQKHALNPHFDWDDKVAGPKWRLEQARNLIRIIRVEDEDAAGGNVRAFVSISDKGGVSYKPMDVVKKSSDLQIALLKSAERDMLAFEARYRELVDICDLVRVARERVVAKRARIETRDAA